MINVFILQQKIVDYRVPFFERLASSNKYSVELYSETPFEKNAAFRYFVGGAVRFRKFKFQYGFWSKIFKGEFSIVVAEFNLYLLSNFFLILMCKLKNIKFIWWGLGFGTSSFGNRFRVFLVNISDGLILYEESAKHKFVAAGVNEKKIFIKHNTVHVNEPEFNKFQTHKNCFLVVGSLNKRKKIDELIEGFALLDDQVYKDIKVEIIGDGSEFESLKKLVQEKKMQDRVLFHGRITDEAELKKYFHRAVAVVHPGQAGLTVLHSFAYGVPFITKFEAISGGEIENIVNRKTGVLYRGGVNELSEIMREMVDDFEQTYKMGENAFFHYTTKRSIQNMTDNYTKAFDYMGL